MLDFKRSLQCYLLILGTISFALADFAYANDSEHLDWDIGGHYLAYQENTGWKGVNGDETQRKIYAKQGEDSGNWTEKIEITVLPIAITLNSQTAWEPESIMASEKERIENKKCSTQLWEIHNKDENSILYEWKNIQCPGYHHQQELVRILLGKWYLWMISYGLKDDELTEEERRAYIEHLLKASVSSN